MKLLKTFLAILLTLPPALAGRAITLDDCQRLAAENYPEIRKYRLVEQTGQFNLSNIDRQWLPQITVGAKASWQNHVPELPGALASVIASQGLEFGGLHKDQYNVSVDLYQPVWDGGKSAADREIAHRETADSRASVDVDLYAVRSRVNDLYFGVLLIDENIRQTNLTITLLEANLDRIKSCIANGVAMPSDADEIEARRLTLRQNIAGMESTRHSYLKMLELFTDRQLAGEELTLPDDIMPASDVIRRPELSMFDARIGLLTSRERLLNAALMPRVGFFASGFYGYPGLNYFESMVDGKWSFNIQLGLKVTWTVGALYTRGNDRHKLQIARDEVETARQTFLFNTRLSVEQENGTIAAMRRVIADDDRIVELRRNVRLAAESRLRNGIIDTTDLLLKITDESEAEIARASHRIELLKCIYQLKHTVNQ